MAVAWVAFPLVFGLLCLGCGFLLEWAAGSPLPQALLLPAGFVVFSIASDFAHMSDRTASLGTPLVIALAFAGFGLRLSFRRPSIDPWWIVAGVAAFAVFAAPVVLSGRATFAGYMKLDDIGTYLAMLDRGMHHGYNLTGLPPSTYELTLATSYVYGYPLGSLLPLGIGSEILGRDPAWLWQPYVTFLAAMVAIVLYQLAGSLVRSRRLRALAAFGGAQAALIYGYALWGGIKEISTAFIALLVVALVPWLVRQQRLRAVIPLAAGSAGLLGVLSLGGAAWLLVPLAVAAALIYFANGLATAVRSSVAFLATTCVLAIPAISAGITFLSHTSAFTGGTEYGNLRGRLSDLQAFGIWPAGDFRDSPLHATLTHVLVALVMAGIALCGWLAWRARAWAMLIAIPTVAFAAALYVHEGSPWIGAKSLATSSPFLLGVALVGAAALFELGRRIEAGVLGALLLGGVLWSNVLQYHAVYLAPSARLADLQAIGARYAGQGPTLMTEYDIYGPRHFLRNMTAEGAGELRYHFVYLQTGGVTPLGASPDIDEFKLSSILFYRTLVLRTTGVSSRPPSVYQLVDRDGSYEVWQQAPGASAILEHVPLGSRLQPAAVPACSEVLRLARKAKAAGGMLATVERPAAIVIQPNGVIAAPTTFGSYGETATVIHPKQATTLTLPFTAPAAGDYGVWVSGSFRATVTVSVDGVVVGSSSDELNWPSTFTSFGTVSLEAGQHALAVHYSGPSWRPGSTGAQFGLGPFALSAATDDLPVTYVQPADASSLCGKSLDWIEVVR